MFEQTTMCYIEKDGKYLMLHRIKEENDANKGKWLGVGGHFERGESPEECMQREIFEEAGLTVTEYAYRGIVTFVSDKWDDEQIHLFTVTGFTGEVKECDEGVLAWVDKSEIMDLPMWEGDKSFLPLINSDHPFFSMKIVYEGDTPVSITLDGKKLM